MTKKLVSFDDQAEPGEGLPAAVKAELSATYAPESGSPEYAPQEASPRGWHRVRRERRSVLGIDQRWPNAREDHKIVYVSTAEMYALGADLSLRRSTNGGARWERLGASDGLGTWARLGLFVKTADGSLLTTYHPFANTEPSIVRSTDGGLAFTTVVPPEASVFYLGATSMCQDPVSKKLYLTEYVTRDAATKATWKIKVSADDGATWQVLHEFQRDDAAFPEIAVRHGHSIQWDPIGERIWFLCGDANRAAGLYRVNAAGTGIEPVVMNKHLDNVAGQWAGAVGVMFFPDAVVWGCDQVSNSGLLILPRSEIGKTTPAVISGPTLQSTSFYTARVKSDNTEWLMTTSNENGSGGRLDNMMHVYRVASNGAELDEVAALPTTSPTTFYWIDALSDPLATRADGRVWLSSNAVGPADPNPYHSGYQFAARLGWGADPVNPPYDDLRLFYAPATASSGNVTLEAGQTVNFGVTEAATRTARLYIIEANREQFSGAGAGYLEVYNQSTGQILNLDDNATPMRYLERSQRALRKEHTAPFVYRSQAVFPGQQIRFRLRNTSGGSPAECAATITYAWGY